MEHWALGIDAMVLIVAEEKEGETDVRSRGTLPFMLLPKGDG